MKYYKMVYGIYGINVSYFIFVMKFRHSPDPFKNAQNAS